MDIGFAKLRLDEGKKVARRGWNGKGMFLYKVQGSKFVVNREPLSSILEEGTEVTYNPHVNMYTADGSCVPWLCSQTDFFAEDWEIVK
jgi:hypothetical protein